LDSKSCGSIPTNSRPIPKSWLPGAQTGASDADQVRAMLERELHEDLSGIRPFMRDGRLCFTQRTVALIGRKL
jgi:hypothetical protein